MGRTSRKVGDQKHHQISKSSISHSSSLKSYLQSRSIIETSKPDFTAINYPFRPAEQAPAAGVHRCNPSIPTSRASSSHRTSLLHHLNRQTGLHCCNQSLPTSCHWYTSVGAPQQTLLRSATLQSINLV